MYGLKDFKSVDDRKYYFVNLSKLDLDEKKLVDLLFQPFLKKLRISTIEFLDAKKNLAITDFSLYDFTPFKSGVEITKMGVYTEKWEKTSVGTKLVRTYYDVWLSTNIYCQIELDKIAEYVVKKRYPELFVGKFANIVDRFDEKIRSINFNAQMSVSDLSVLGGDSLKIGDLVNIISNEGFLNGSINKPKLKIYCDKYGKCDCYLELNGTDKCLAFDIENLFDKDWGSIEEKNVYVGLKKVKQKDTDYFSNSLVKTFKEEFFS